MSNILIGKIVNTHGIKGELRVISNTDFPEIRFAKNAKIIIKNQEYTVSNMRFHKNFCLITLVGFSNINEVLNLVKTEIYQEQVEEINLDKDEIHLLKIKGYQVLELNSQKIIGSVKTIIKNPGNDLLVVTKKNQKELVIPIVKEFIKDQDDQQQIVNVRLIEGFDYED